MAKKRTNVPKYIRDFILDFYHDICVYCGDEATEVDHVVPYSLVLCHKPDNLVASCLPCNRTGWSYVFDSFEEKRAFILERRVAKLSEQLQSPPIVLPTSCLFCCKAIIGPKNRLYCDWQCCDWAATERYTGKISKKAQERKGRFCQ